MELKIEDIKNVLILGSGTLGLRVGLQSAISGFDTIIYDINDKAIEQAKATQGKILKSLLKREIIDEALAQKALSRIKWSTDAASAAAEADFINESVTEDLEIKKKVWEQFGQLCPKHTLFTSNTSYMMPSTLADFTGRPAQFCAFHFHDVFVANVVDIMPHPGTEPWIIELLKTMGKRLNQTPVVVNQENPGYIFNYMLMAMLGAAGALLTKGIANFEDVDRSWMGNFNMPVGPFGMMDNVGLDTTWSVLKTRTDEKSKRFAAFLKTYVDQGKLGIKSGEGFYKYPNPAYKAPNFIQEMNQVTQEA